MHPVLNISAGMDTADAMRFLAEDSGNVDDAGNFSIQVLNTALMRSHNLQLVQDGASLHRALQNIDDADGDGGMQLNSVSTLRHSDTKVQVIVSYTLYVSMYLDPS
jgi:hypothetical protein